MIIVTGATGKLGQAVTKRLLDLIPADQIGVSVRDPEKAHTLREQGVRVRRGDFADLESLRHAFEGASQVLVISVNSAGDAAVQQHRNAIEAAKAASAQRVLYTSHVGAHPASLFPPMRDHAATEDVLRTSGMAFTSLRNGFYAESGFWLMGDALKTGKIVAPKDGPVSWTTHADLAGAAVVALTQEGRLDGVTPPLTASEALDLEAIAGIVSRLTGREITRATVTDEEYRAAMIARGTPETWADMSVGLFAASRKSEFAAVAPTLEGLLGRPPTSMQNFISAGLAKFAQ